MLLKAIDINENNKALVRITTTPDNAEILFESSDGISFISKNKINPDSQGINEATEVSLDYGIWSITIDYGYEAKTVELNVDTYKIYELDLRARLITVGISIDMDNPDPADAVTYTGDAVGFQPLAMNFDTGVCDYGDWFDLITTDILIGCKPKHRGKYVNPNDYTKYIDGTDVVNAFSDAYIKRGDTNMYIEFKRTWYRYKLEGNILSFELSNYKQDGFCSAAFDGPHLYYSVYPSVNYDHNYNGNVCVSGVSDYNKYSVRYDHYLKFEPLRVRSYILGLLMLVTKTRDIKSVIGIGNCSDTLSATGTGDSLGLFYGSQEPGHPVKCFGIENMWGNCEELIGGISHIASTSSPYGKLVYDDSVTSNDDTGLPSTFTIVNDELTRISAMPDNMDDISYNNISFIKPVICSDEYSCIIPFRDQADSSIGWPDPILLISNGSLYTEGIAQRNKCSYVIVGGGSGDSIIKNPGPFSAVFGVDVNSDRMACVRVIRSDS